MGRLFLLFTFSFAVLWCRGQQEAGDSEDSLAAKSPLIRPSIRIDYGKLLTIASDFETKYEGGIELLFRDNYPLIIEVGSAELSPKDAIANGQYQSDGIYYRIGGGYYKQRTPKNGFGLYAMYGFSTFKEEGEFSYFSPSLSQENFVSDPIVRDNLSANWWELVLYTDQSLNSFLKIGFSVRYRRLLRYDQFDPIDVYAIPGYGRSLDKSIPAANFILKVSL